MLLQKALRALDGEIQRLSRVRAIVAGLHTTRSLTEYASSTPQELLARDQPSPSGAGQKTTVEKTPSTEEPDVRARAETKSPLKAKKRGALKYVTDVEVEVSMVSEPMSAVAASEPIASDAEASALEIVGGQTAASEPRKLRRLRFERATRTRRAAQPEARALGGTIPVRPVYISSADAVRTPAKARVSESVHKTPQTLAPEGTLDALLRELSYRPSQGA